VYSTPRSFKRLVAYLANFQASFPKTKMNEQATIWYQLVRENGDKLGSIDAIVMKLNSAIFQFRKQVKAENPNKLSHCDASDLVVYRNKEEFASKISLEEDLAVSGLGQSKANALYVLVPTKVGVDGNNHS
jgi:hypothetical protein